MSCRVGAGESRRGVAFVLPIRLTLTRAAANAPRTARGCDAMWLEAILSQEDFSGLATELFPLSVHLGASDSGHYLLLSAATAVSLVEGRGLRFTCNAQIRWPVLGMDVPINIEALTVLVEPSVPDGSESLVLGVQLEHANVSWLPALVDAKIVEAVNDALKTKSRELSWNFTKTLSHGCKRSIASRR
jgi:hypothetical protein